MVKYDESPTAEPPITVRLKREYLEIAMERSFQNKAYIHICLESSIEQKLPVQIVKVC